VLNIAQLGLDTY